MQHLLSYLYKNDIKELKKEKKKVFPILPVQVADSSVCGWNLDGFFSELQWQMQCCVENIF